MTSPAVPPPGPLGIGLNLPTWPRADGTLARWPEIRTLALDAESLGVDALWVPDHLTRVLASGRTVEFRECWTILTATAEATSRVLVGPFVACTGFRNPGLLARMADTLDGVSGGRLVLGLGSGTPATDTSWRQFGFEASRPVGRFAESVEVVARLRAGETVSFAGSYVRTEGASLGRGTGEALAFPLWVAARGERTMAVAARWADAVNVNVPLAGPDDVVQAAAAALTACALIGRDPATLSLTGWCRIALDAQGNGVQRRGWLAGSPAELAAALRSLAAAGLRHVSVYIGRDDDQSPLPALTGQALERFAIVLAALRAG